MEVLRNLLSKYKSLATVFKSFFILMILFLVFFGVNLIIDIKNQDKSAYTSLRNEKSEVKLQDTRVHNWNEIEKK